MDSATLKRTHDRDPLHSPDGTSPKRWCTLSSVTATAPTRAHQIIPSPFGDVQPKFSSEEIVADIQDETRRLQRRMQPGFQAGAEGASTGWDYPMSSASSFSSQMWGGLLPPENLDQPMFTVRDVVLMCEQRMKEQEKQIREEYDRELSTKLAEQYDAFLKFTQDQVYKRAERDMPSYLA